MGLYYVIVIEKNLSLRSYFYMIGMLCIFGVFGFVVFNLFF